VTERHRAVNYALISCDLSIMLSTVRYISSVGLQKPIHLLTGRRQSLSMPYWAQRSALSPRTKQIPVCYYSARPTHSSDTRVFFDAAPQEAKLGKPGASIHMGQGGHVPPIFGLAGHYHECPPQYF